MTVEEKEKRYENIVRRNQNLTDEPRQKKQVKSKEWFKNLTEEKRKDGIHVFLKGDEPKPKKELKQPFLKLSPEERRERERETDNTN